jgi:hypothetical protein
MAGGGSTTPSVEEMKQALGKFLEPSKVKERLYHGTNKNIQAFDSNANKIYRAGHLGHFFSASPSVSNEYATGEGGNVMPVHISLKNPAEEGIKRLGRFSNVSQIKKYKQDLIAKGHDGVIFYGPGKSTEYVVFNPTQIKSAIGNQGTYDTSNPDITKKEGGTVKDYIRITERKL